MKTIRDKSFTEIEIKNSRFITVLYKVNDVSDIDKILKEVRLQYKDATHCCYAYVIDGFVKSSDDGEPGGTAGVPILQVLQKNDLNYVLAVVIRYFGGIKLGASGLVRAYTKSVTSAITEDIIVKLVKGYNIRIEFNYDLIKEVDYLLRDSIINNKIFQEKIEYDIDIKEDMLDIIEGNRNIKIIEKKDKFILE